VPDIFSETRLPCSIEAEMAVIGACLESPIGRTICIQELKPKHFYSQNHRTIFEVIHQLDEAGFVDTVTVQSRLTAIGKLEEVGGFTHLMSCIHSCPTPNSPMGYVAIVREKAERREFYLALTDSRAKVLDETRLFDQVKSEVQERVLSAGEMPVDTITAQSWVESVRAEAAEVEAGVDGRRRIKAGISLIDNKVNMWPGRLTVVAGDTGIGKSVYSTKLIRESCLRLNQRVVAWLGEMDKPELYERIFAAEVNLDYSDVQHRRLSQKQVDQMATFATKLDAAPLTILDKAMTVAEIRAFCRYLKHTEGAPDLVVIDYLLLLKDLNTEAEGSDRRDVRIGIIVWNLIEMAKELGCHVVLVHQFNRMKSARTIGRPRLSDLKESSAIEQHSYNVLLLYRPDRDESLDPDDRAQYVGYMEVIVAKARGGKVGNVWLNFNGENQEIRDRHRPWPGDGTHGALPLPGTLTAKNRKGEKQR
jgi:replicative DNA helicase